MHAWRAPGHARRTGHRRRQAYRLSAQDTHGRAPRVGASLAALLVLAVAATAIVVHGLPARPQPSVEGAEAEQVATAPPLTAQPTILPTLAPTSTPALMATTPMPTATATLRAVKGVVALTFDAGADRGYAEDILDLLAAAHAPSSFGVTGEWASRNADLVRRMEADGHLVINHTLDHRSFTGLSDERGGLTAARRRAELEQADAVIAPLIGHTTRPWYRLPYGDDDAQVASDLAPLGFTRKVGWTVDSGGWRGWPATDIVAHCLEAAEAGAIYVLHVGRDSQDGLALGPLIAGLRDRGYGFATVGDLP